MNITDIYDQNGIVLQKLSYSCGAVALLNILHVKSDFSRTEEELAEICNAKEHVGTSHDDLVRSVPLVGLEVVEHKASATLRDVERNIDAGHYVIVNYKNAFSGNGHYGVIVEYSDDSLYLRDSTFGLVRFEKGMFERAWVSGDGIPQWYLAVR